MKRVKKSFLLASGIGATAALAQVLSVAISLAPSTLLAIGQGQSVLTYLDGAQTETLEISLTLVGGTPDDNRYTAQRSSPFGIVVFDRTGGPGVESVPLSVIQNLNLASPNDGDPNPPNSDGYPNSSVAQDTWNTVLGLF